MSEAQKKIESINDFFRQFYPKDWEGRSPGYFNGWRYVGKAKGRANIFPRVECADGFSMSVQGHNGAYSMPRDDFADFYAKVEVGFPSAREEALMPYIDGGPDTDPTQTVYGYVPVSIVEKIIAGHGGFAVLSRARGE